MLCHSKLNSFGSLLTELWLEQVFHLDVAELINHPDLTHLVDLSLEGFQRPAEVKGSVNSFQSEKICIIFVTEICGDPSSCFWDPLRGPDPQVGNHWPKQWTYSEMSHHRQETLWWFSWLTLNRSEKCPSQSPKWRLHNLVLSDRQSRRPWGYDQKLQISKGTSWWNY